MTTAHELALVPKDFAARAVPAPARRIYPDVRIATGARYRATNHADSPARGQLRGGCATQTRWRWRAEAGWGHPVDPPLVARREIHVPLDVWWNI